VLADWPVHTTLPCSDHERAKRFYSGKLGLSPSTEQPGAAFYEAPGGSRFLLFASSGSASGTHTQMGWRVSDIDAEVRGLKDRGVRFEEYDFPGFDKQTSIAQTGPIRSAWFKDSEGNLLGLVQLPAE
jgi:catechol 2,3-dioxygenase-like lactoylglutathione lyase family enzyme